MRLTVGGAVAAPTAMACCRFLWMNPVTLALSFLVAFLLATSAGPLAAMLAILAGGAITLAASPLSITRRLLRSAVERQRRRERNERREQALERAGSTRRGELDELNGLVEEIDASDPAECARLQLEELVDHYVEMAVVVESYRNAARRSSGLSPAPEGEQERTSAGARLRRELVGRRIAHRDQCLRRVDDIEGELDAVTEFVRLVAQRSACPAGEEPVDPLLERRLWELDACDSAVRQLAVGDPAAADQ